MSDIAIRVENLSKKYKIGANQTRYQTLRESIMNGVSTSLERLKGNQPKEENIIWALKDINFEVKHGEVLGIIGRNGAGKSTLLKILSRITKPTTGRFELNGRVGSLLEVGTGFHPELTGRENIYLSGAILGMKRKEINRKFDEIVDFAEIEKFLDTPVKHYSSGMYMRLAFSVAAHLEPEILLVDEVLAVGDAGFQRKCIELMSNFSNKDRTILVVSHNLATINFLCKKGIFLESGKIFLDGNISEVINQYTKKMFSESNLDNNVEVKSRRGSGRARFKRITLSGKNNNPTQTLFMGDPLHVNLEIDVFQKINDPIIGILIKDYLGNTVLRAYSYESSKLTPSLKNNSSLFCFFNQINLMHGQYFIDLWLSENNEVIDYVENASKLLIEQSDVYKTGKFPDKNNGGLVFSKHSWKFNF